MSCAALQARVAARVGSLALDLTLHTEGTLVVIGPNGAGKSSLLAALLGDLPLESGKIRLGETALFDSAMGIDLPVEQRGIGYVPQDYALFPYLDVWRNIEFALQSMAHKLSRPERETCVARVLSDLGIERLAKRRVHSLSGGEKQKVALARALSVAPRALLLDEPLAALDVHARREVRAFLAEYLARLNLPTVIVTHDAADARVLGNTIVVLENGKITQLGNWDDLRARPTTPFVAEFVRSASEQERISAGFDSGIFAA